MNVCVCVCVCVKVTNTNRVEPKSTTMRVRLQRKFSLLRFPGEAKTGRSVMQANKSEEEHAGYPKSPKIGKQGQSGVIRQKQANRVKAG